MLLTSCAHRSAASKALDCPEDKIREIGHDLPGGSLVAPTTPERWQYAGCGQQTWCVTVLPGVVSCEQPPPIDRGPKHPSPADAKQNPAAHGLVDFDDSDAGR